MAYKPEEIEKIFTEVCRLIAQDGLSVRKSLQKKGMPIQNTFFKWIKENEEKKEQYVRACEARAELIFEDILHIADDTTKDTRTVDIGGIEIETINHDAIQRSKLRVDARKWMLGKMQPKKYGDKIDVTSDGEKIQESKINLNISGKEITLK